MNMFSDPDKPTEEALKAYASQRAGEARDLNLEPWTQKTLMSEARRIHGTKLVKTGSPSPAVPFSWIKLGFIASMCAVFTLVMVLIFHSGSDGRMASVEQEKVGEMTKLETLADDMSPKAVEEKENFSPKNDSQSGPAAVLSLSRDNSVGLEESQKLAGGVEPPSPSSSPATTKIESVRESLVRPSKGSGAEAEGAFVAVAESDGAKANQAALFFEKKTVARFADKPDLSRTSAEVELAMDTPSSPASSKLASGNRQSYMDSSSTLSLRMSSTDQRSKLKQNLLSPPLPVLLQNFQIVRSNEFVHIFDSDGSVYAGKVSGPGRQDAAIQGSAFSFQAEGNNLVLKKGIVVRAQLLNSEASAQGGSKNSRYQLEGRVSIGNREEMPIQAEGQLQAPAP